MSKGKRRSLLTKIEEVRQEKEREEVFEATRNSYQTAMENVFALQEETLRFARSLIEDSAQTAHKQAERNRATVQTLTESSRRQREAVEELLKASAKAYTDLFYASFSGYPRYRELLEAMVPTGALDTAPKDESGGRRPGESLPIRDYDSLNVSEVGQEVECNGLTAEDLKKLKSHEQANKDRRTLVELFDRGIEKASS